MPARLLVIDDDPIILNLVQQALGKHSVATASSGEQGLELYAIERFDAVICDLGLPGIDGFEVIRRIRQQTPAAPVLVITGRDPQAKLIASLRENIVDFLAKPFAVEDLRTAIDNILESEKAAIAVTSATPQWIELSIPASFQMVSRLGKFFDQLHAEIDAATRESISTAFRELLMNAIEHGCQGDVRRRISICYLRLSRVIVYRISDPGGGFTIDEELSHAAIVNPPDDPFRHIQIREERGMRGGGFGILWAKGIADELIYNEQGNEVVFARYL